MRETLCQESTSSKQNSTVSSHLTNQPMTSSVTFTAHQKACLLCLRFLQANKNLDKLLKSKGEQEKRKKNVQKMQSDAVSDNEEDEEAAEQMAANAERQAQTLQAEDGDPEPEVLQQVLFPHQVQGHAHIFYTSGAVPCTRCLHGKSRAMHRLFHLDSKAMLMSFLNNGPCIWSHCTSGTGPCTWLHCTACLLQLQTRLWYVVVWSGLLHTAATARPCCWHAAAPRMLSSQQSRGPAQT